MGKIILIAAGVALGIIGAGVIKLVFLASGSSSWRVNEWRDPMTDAPSAAAYLKSADGAEIGIVCTSGGPLQLTIQTAQRLTGYEDGAPARVVSFRFDDGPIQDTWGGIADNYIGFSGNDAPKRGDLPILAGLEKARRLGIQTLDSDSNDVRFSFDLTGADDALERVRKGCGKGG